MSKAKIDKRRQNWMLSLSNNVKNLGGHGGRIDWDTANHLYNTGIGSTTAAFKIVEAQKKDQEPDYRDDDIITQEFYNKRDARRFNN